MHYVHFKISFINFIEHTSRFCIVHDGVDLYPFQHYCLDFLMFEFPCIISLYYIKKQKDATLAVLFISNC